MALSPFELIKKGATGLINSGKSFFTQPDNSTFGIIKNTITGLPTAGIKGTLSSYKEPVKEIAVTTKDLAQSTLRGLATLGTGTASLIESGKSGFQKEISSQVNPDGKFGKALFGTDKPFSLTSEGKPFANLLGAKEGGRTEKVLSPIIGTVFPLLDAIPGGKPAKTAFKKFAPEAIESFVKTTDPVVIKRALLDVGTDLKTAERASIDIAMATDKNIVENILKGVSVSDTVKPAISSNGQTLYHGTRGEMLEDKNRVLFTASEKGVAESYSNAVGISRTPSKVTGMNFDGEKYLLNAENKFISSETGKSINFYDGKRLIERREAEPLLQNATVKKVSLGKDKKILDLTKKENVQELINTLENIKKTNKNLTPIQARKLDVFIAQTKENGFDWGLTTDEFKDKFIGDVISPELKKKGYSGILFQDDMNKTTALFPGEWDFVQEVKPVVSSTGIKAKGFDDAMETAAKDVEKSGGLFNRIKTTIIDYLRTPDRVINKLGLGEEMKALRVAHQNYLKDFQSEVSKISAWKKSLPRSSSKTIFQYLDGQPNIKLTDAELTVANNIKSDLAKWADRLNLPQERRISNYITRIFDDSIKSGQMDESLAFIVNNKLPKGVFNPYELERAGATGYVEDVWRALDAYVSKATRKVNLDEAIKNFDVANKLPEADWEYVKNFLDGVNFRPTKLDKLTDATIERALSKLGNVGAKISQVLGPRPTKKILSPLRAAGYRGTLGLNIGSALKNLSQGINTVATIGEKNSFKGYAALFKKSNMKELVDEGILNYGFIEDRISSQMKDIVGKVDDKLFAFFESAEKINRGAAYFGAKAKALSEGKTPQEAIEYAKEIVRKTQFQFGELDTPLFLRSQLFKTFLQLQSFSVKQSEFLIETALKDKNFAGLLRYAVYGIIFVKTIGELFDMDMKDLMPGFRLEGGLVFKPIIEGTKSLLGTKDKYGNERTREKRVEDFTKTLIPFIPAGSQIRKTIQGINAIQEGGSFTASGNLQFTVPQDAYSRTQAILFGKYASDNAQDYFNKAVIKKEEQDKILPIYNQVQELVKSGDEQAAKNIVNNLSEADYNTYKEIKKAETTKKTLETKKAVLPVYLEVQKLKSAGDTTRAQDIVNGLSEEEYKAYKLIKDQVERDNRAAKGTKPEYQDGEPQTTKSVLSTVWTYAKALGVDPKTAFNRIFTGQKIRYVTNGTVVVERLPLKESQAIKSKSGQDMGETKLDHTIPLQLGGSNDEDNLNLVPNEIFITYTPVENALGKALRDKKIDKGTAQKLIEDFKNGEITKEDVLSYIK